MRNIMAFLVLATAGLHGKNDNNEDTQYRCENGKHRRTRFLFIVVTFLLIGWVPLLGQEISEQDNHIVDKIKQANAQYTAITSDFKQTKRLAIVEGETVAMGKFYYLKPESLAMYYIKPAKDMMLIAGDRFYMRASGKITKALAKTNSKVRRMKAILASALQGDVKQIDYKRITCNETDKYYSVTVEISGKARNGVINKVSVSYDKTDYSPAILKTEEPDGSYTEYELTSKTFNQAPEAKIFTAPKASR